MPAVLGLPASTLPETGEADARRMSRLIGCSIVVVAVVAAGVIGYVVRDQTHGGDGIAPVAAVADPDTPPAEFIYLDAARVQAYLGQEEGGFAASKKETRQVAESVNASLSAGAVASAGASRQTQNATEATVTPTVADDFYAFLRLLRTGPRGMCPHGDGKWLHTIDASLHGTNTVEAILQTLRCVSEGDYLRITNAHLYLPPYASALSGARYALGYYNTFQPPVEPFSNPALTPALRRAVADYTNSLGPNPRLPFVVPALSTSIRSQPKNTVTLFVPVRYRGLTAEPSLLSGQATIIGKVVYKDYRRGPLRPDERFPGSYTDINTVTEFTNALLHASPTLLKDLQLCPRPSYNRIRGATARASKCNLPRSELLGRVRRSVTFPSPDLVIIPIAIYQ